MIAKTEMFYDLLRSFTGKKVTLKACPT